MGIVIGFGHGIAFGCRRGVVEAIAAVVNERSVRSSILQESMTEEELERFNAIGGFSLRSWAREDLLELDESLAAIENGERPRTVVWDSEMEESIVKYVHLFRDGYVGDWLCRSEW